jgi:polyhydroxyalkanoate synthase
MDMFDLLRLDPAIARRIKFLLRQGLDAASPANFLGFNPEAIALAQKTHNASVQEGLRRFADDVARGRISTSDETAYEVGRNLAITPGAVVYENAAMQLIQYRASTSTTHERPLFIVPPFINKYYILDLQARNSFVRFCVEQGITVFMVSWRNPGIDAPGNFSWDDYLRSGVLAPLQVVGEICPGTGVNALGFCVGGTLLTSAMAVADEVILTGIHSLTLLATMLDFSDAGELSVFVDEAFVRQAEQDYQGGGVVPAERLADTFSLLRANDLIWNFIVNNYLKGQQPRAFDLLYWNADSTNVPGPLYAYYLRSMYLENKLRVAGALTMLDRPVNLARLQTPVYALAAREDHIVPWRTAYHSAQLLTGPKRFILAQSGHVAGIVNPPHGRGYAKGPMTDDPDQWLTLSEEVPGSWWLDWVNWLKPQLGKLTKAPYAIGSPRYPALEPAPGRYVRMRSN